MGIYCNYSNTDFLHPPCTPVDQGQQGCAPLCTPPLNPPLVLMRIALYVPDDNKPHNTVVETPLIMMLK